MSNLKNIIKKEKISISKDIGIHEAIEIMYSNHEGCVVILDDQEVVGILTERDVISFLNDHMDMEQSVYEIAKKSVISINAERSVEYALHILIDNNIRRLIVLDHNNHFAGVVTQEMIVGSLEEEHYQVSLKVSQVLSASDKDLISMDVNDNLENAISLMDFNAVGSVLVTRDGVIEGILTERDVVHYVSQDAPMDTQAREIMSSPVIRVSMDDNIKYIVDLMHEKEIRRVVANDKQGNAVGIIGTRDVIKNIKGNYGVFVENKLKYTKQALNTIGEVIFELYNDNGTMLIQWANSMAIQRYSKEIIDQSVTSLIDEEIWSNLMSALLENGEINDFKISIREQQYLLSCSHGTKKDIKKGFFIICKDVTEYELKLLELNKNLDVRIKEEIAKNEEYQKENFQKNKLIQMGEMIGMIAHQWRQPLNSISATGMNLTLLSSMGILESNKIEQSSEFIQDQCQKMSSTIDTFMNFVKPAKESKEFKVTHTFKEVMSIMGTQLLNHNVDVNIETLDDNISLIGHEDLLEQVIINIFSNARDAFEELQLSKQYVDVVISENDEAVTISIEDNAGGIEREISDKIFNPYFTTKEQGKGTGIGLYMSMDIMKKSFNGDLKYKAIPNGSRFEIICGKRELMIKKK